MFPSPVGILYYGNCTTSIYYLAYYGKENSLPLLLGRKIKRLRQLANELERTMLDDYVKALPPEKQADKLRERQERVKWIYENINDIESTHVLSRAQSWGIEPPVKPEWYAKINIELWTKLGSKADLETPLEEKRVLNSLGR